MHPPHEALGTHTLTRCSSNAQTRIPPPSPCLAQDWTVWYETVALDDVMLQTAIPFGGIPRACYT
jgi:hypothetical protein